MRKLVTAAVATLSLAVAIPAAAQNVGIATSNPGSLLNNIGTALAKAANAGGLNATIQPATSPNQFIPFLNTNGIEFGVANLQEVNYALTDEAWWNGQKYPNLRIIATLQPLVEAIFVRKDSDIKTLTDLKGTRMTDGYTAQNTILPQPSAFYATAGMTRDDEQKVSVASVVAGADAFMAGDTVGLISAHGAGKVCEANAAIGEFSALGVGDDSPAALAAARKFWPTAFFKILPVGAMPGVLEDTTYIDYPQVIFTNAAVSDDVAYQTAKAMYKNAKIMRDTFPPMRAFNPEDMMGDPGNVEYRPGALKFYKEVG